MSRVPSWPEAEERYRYVRSILASEAPPPADVVEFGAAPGVLSVALARAGYGSPRWISARPPTRGRRSPRGR